MTEKVSVIIPAWGETPYLERACDSIRRQTHPDVELIVAAPPADAPQTALAARWAGLAKAGGEWIGFCDADDWLEPAAIAEMLAAAARDRADCVCCGLVRDRADGVSVRKMFDRTGPSDTYNALVTKLFRRNLLEGLVLDRTVTLGEDLMVTAQALAKAQRIAVLDEAFYHYCENAASVTHVQDGRRRVECYALFVKRAPSVQICGIIHMYIYAICTYGQIFTRNSANMRRLRKNNDYNFYRS